MPNPQSDSKHPSDAQSDLTEEELNQIDGGGVVNGLNVPTINIPNMPAFGKKVRTEIAANPNFNPDCLG